MGRRGSGECNRDITTVTRSFSCQRGPKPVGWFSEVPTNLRECRGADTGGPTPPGTS